MCSSKIALALVASIALVSALPAVPTDVLGGVTGGNGGGLGGILGGGQGGLGGIIGGGDQGGLLGGLLGGVLGGEGGLSGVLEGILTSPDGLGSILTEVVNSTPLGKILEPLLTQVFQLVASLLTEIEKVLGTLSEALTGVTGALNGSTDPTSALSELLNNSESPIGINTIFYIASQLAQPGGNGGVVPPLPTPVPVPAVPEVPQIPV